MLMKIFTVDWLTVALKGKSHLILYYIIEIVIILQLPTFPFSLLLHHFLLFVLRKKQ